jgi:hypothetical protein
MDEGTTTLAKLAKSAGRPSNTHCQKEWVVVSV